MDLLIEIKILIASFKQETWIKLVIYDSGFCQYAYSRPGRKRFIDLFTVIKLAERFTFYELFGLIHRSDGPAVRWLKGTWKWYQNNKLHRDDGPAIIYSSGDQYWYQNNKLHSVVMVPL